jgi:aspartate kinase
LASRGGITVLTVSSTRMLAQSGFLARLFELFGRHDVSVDLIATAEVSVSLTVEADVPLAPLLEELHDFARVTVVEGRAIVAVVGEDLRNTPGISGRLFKSLADVNVEMISMGANEINLSMVVKESDAPRALRGLHAAIMEGAG